MKRAPRAAAIRRPKGLLAHALVLVTVLAFALQGFVTQTHIHVHSAGGPVAVGLFDGKPAKNAPVKDDESNCPLCQAFASSGSFVTPAIAALLPPHVAVSIIPFVPLGASLLRTVTHTWRGRAPPLD